MSKKSLSEEILEEGFSYDTETKAFAERLNGYAALVGCIALVGAYVTTGQIIPGFV